jgi:hypothetical protein
VRVKQLHSEPGEVVLQGRELGVQLGKLPEQVRQRSSRGTVSGRCCSSSRHQGLLQGGSSGQIREWTTMQACHF